MGALSERNQLYPVFFRLDKVRILVVGAGDVGMEKLEFIYKSSPNARVKVVAKDISEEVMSLARSFQNNLIIEQRSFENRDVIGADIVIAATNDSAVNLNVYYAAKKFGKIINVADTPEYCDFYMGSIVTRGDLKVAISTNGKSPTFSKRFRQVLEEILPEESNDLLQNLRLIRNRLKGNFRQKVIELNRITESLLVK